MTTSAVQPVPKIGTLLRVPFQPREAIGALAGSVSKVWLLGAVIITMLVTVPATMSARMAAAQLPPIQAPPAEIQHGASQAPNPGGSPDAPPEMMQSTQPTLLSPDGMISLVFGAMGLWVAWLLRAFVLYFGSVLLGGRAAFGGVFKAIVLSYAPLAVRGVLQLAYLNISGQALGAAGLSGFVLPGAGSSPGAPAAPDLGAAVLGLLLSNIDLFQIWSAVVLVIGLCAVARVKTGASAALVLVTLLITTLVFGLPQLIGALSGGSPV